MSKSASARFWLLAATLVLAGQVASGSSYLDDYFLPTAKIALNKIQQSLSPASNQQPQLHITEQSLNPNQTSTTTTTLATSDSVETTPVSSSPVPVQELGGVTRNEGELVKLDGSQANQFSSVDYAQPTSQLPVQPDPAESSSSRPVDSSTSAELATESDPTTTTQQSTQNESTTSTESGRSATETPAPATTGAAEEKQQTSVAVVESNEAAIKETELEAVAAVDASIGFGDIFGGATGAGGSSLGDSCYDEYANARYCEPEFENIAYERQVEVSSECGTPPSRFCTAYLNERHEQIRNCHICDAQHPKKRHPAAYLTDLNNSNSPTCWVSAPIAAANSSAAPATAAQETATATSGRLAGDNVTLVLNLDKKYEIVYISLQFCSMKPDSLAIYKSSDYGRTYTPYQFYSSQCRRQYGRPTAGRSGLLVGAHGALEAACTNSTAGPTASGSAAASGRIAFSTLDGRSGHSLERSAQLQDWITATNIKIVLDRHQASWIHSNLVHPHAHYHHHHPTARNASEPGAAPEPAAGHEPDSSLTSPSDTFNYAMSDLIVGGQCKCNGHASRCIHSKDASRLQCDCRHNTAGRDCEKCAPFHFDRPWARATQLDANPCQPCNCNGHSRKCRFDAELYRMSGKRSGGVCIGCRDNTAGRFCNYCKEGFTRDHSKPMSDKEACKHCDCHPIGSLGRACNQTTGQCPCKEGVSGLQCNRCAPGYQQSSSLTDPCIKIPDNENDINYYPPLAVDGDDQASASQEHPPDLATSPDQPNLGLADTPSDGQSPSWPRANKPPVELVEQQLPVGQDSSAAGQPSGEPQPEARPQDKDDDTSDSGDPPTDPPPPPSYARKQAGRPRLASHWQPQRKSAAASYYGYHQTARSRHPQFEPPLEEDELTADDEDDLPRLRRPASSADPDADYPTGRGYYYNLYGGGKRYAAEYAGARKHRPAARHRQPPPDLLPVASLEHGPDNDELNSLEEATSGGYPMHSIYSQGDEANFNQIQTPSQVRRQMASSMQARRQHSVGVGRPKLPQYPSGQLAMAGHREQAPPMSEVVCGDCQASTRRLSSRQFCHLQFAIRATILNKYMADDWTKFEVEIQDIFKSGGAPEPATPALLDNMLQADEPMLRTMDNATFTSAAAAGAPAAASIDGMIDATSGAGSGGISAGHRIKVGTVQSIWVPTEDLGCRCPRLKPRATYLLMGSIDAKENSANALQLDRHGVALEWKSSLQEKMLRYQRRQSRGKC